jgi:hypothetical protein
MANIMKVNDRRTLRKLGDLLRDGRIRESEIRPTVGRDALTIDIWLRTDRTVTSGRAWWPFVWEEVAARKSVLEVRYVNHFVVTRHRHANLAGIFSLSRIRLIEANSILVETYDGMTLSIVVERLECVLHLTNQFASDVGFTRLRIRPFGQQSGPEKD